MKNQIRVMPLESEHLEDAGKLLVQRVESEYQNLPGINEDFLDTCLLYTSPSPRD